MSKKWITKSGVLSFDPTDPFPLLLPDAATYAEEQEHAAEVDRWLGMDSERIEAQLLAHGGIEGQQLWIGLPLQALQTPYTELRAIVERLAPAPSQTLVDLGAGYGRLGLVVARHFPDARFLGYEYVTERVTEGLRCMARAGVPAQNRLVRADLSQRGFQPEAADFYLLYDYGTRQAIAKTLEDLRLIARTRPITVVGRGRAVRDAIERGQPWLSKVHEPEHRGRHSIYRS